MVLGSHLRTLAIALGVVAGLLLAAGLWARALPSRGLVVQENSRSAITGEHQGLDVMFSSIEKDNGSVTVRLEFPTTALVAEFGAREGARFRSLSVQTGELAALEADEVGGIAGLRQMIIGRYDADDPPFAFPSSRVANDLLLILETFQHTPPGTVVDLDTSMPVPEESRLRTPLVFTPLCDSVGEVVEGTYTLADGLPRTESEVLGPCHDGECFGRCGPTCLSPPFPPEIQTYTQECLNHDLCCRAIGGGPGCFSPFDPDCGDEWRAAVDGARNGPDCAAIEGAWGVMITGTSCLGAGQLDCIDIDLGTVTYDFAQDKDEPEVFSGSFTDKLGHVGVFAGERDLGAIRGIWAVPTYMDEACGSGFLGTSGGRFFGDNECGAFSASLRGSWRRFDPITCSDVGKGNFRGGAAAESSLAETETVVIPNVNEETPGRSNNAFPFNNGDMRYQQVYAADQFQGLAGIVSEIAFRVDEEAGNSFDSAPIDTEIRLSHTSAVPQGLSLTFDDNVGPDETLVWDGPLTLSSDGIFEFDIVLDVDDVFAYNGADNLLVEIKVFGPSFTSQFDSAGTGLGEGGTEWTDRLFAFGPDAETGSSTGDDGYVTQFTILPSAFLEFR